MAHSWSNKQLPP